MKKPNQITFLVVDDNADLRTMISSLFKTFDFNVLEAENGRIAWGLIQSNEIDVVLTDIRMPVMDGIELLAKIRARDPQFPCVIVTSGFTDHHTATLYDLGADGFLGKPVGASAIRGAIQRALLSKADLWKPPSTGAHEIKIAKRFTSFEDMLVSGELHFGRGGFFVRQRNPIARVGEGVAFNFLFDTHEPVSKIEGTGVVRWVTTMDNEAGRAGLGIEIKHLGAPGRDLYCEWLAKQKIAAFIPVG